MVWGNEYSIAVASLLSGNYGRHLGGQLERRLGDCTLLGGSAERWDPCQAPARRDFGQNFGPDSLSYAFGGGKAKSKVVPQLCEKLWLEPFESIHGTSLTSIWPSRHETLQGQLQKDDYDRPSAPVLGSQLWPGLEVCLQLEWPYALETPRKRREKIQKSENA